MIAVLPVRDGAVVAGSEEAVAEAGGVAVVAGDGAAVAAADLAARAGESHAGRECRELRVLELGASFRPAQWADAIAPHVEPADVVVLPASPDGRDLAPRLATVLGRPLLAGAIAVTEHGARLAWLGGRQIARFRADGPFVSTLLPGSRATIVTSGRRDPDPDNGVAKRVDVHLLDPVDTGADGRDAELLRVIAADPSVTDLAEAVRIVVAGAGAGGMVHVALLEVVAAGLGASFGATRVVTDAGWLGHDRQIGTTGVSVRPRCYVAFGVSGAAQHLGGIGTPSHVISVNLDRSCPMMELADLALVTDAKALIEVLAQRLQSAQRLDPVQRLESGQRFESGGAGGS